MTFRRGIRLAIVLTIFAGTARVAHGQPPAGDAWPQLPSYEYGQDMAPLLAIEREVIAAMASDASRHELAARLANLLSQPSTTAAARQFICLQLRQVGTPAEVPVLARLLAVPETSEMARQTLAVIPGPTAQTALREALLTLQDDALVGVINTLGTHRDSPSVQSLTARVDSPQPRVREAAIRALGNIADRAAVDFLRAQAARESAPWPRDLTDCLLHAASVLARQGDRDEAANVFASLAGPGQRPATRRAAWEGLLQLEMTGRVETIRRWLTRGDPVQQQVAARHVSSLPDAALDELVRDVGQLSDQAGLVVLEVLSQRRRENLLPLALELIQTGQPTQQLVGIRCLGALHSADTIPVLLDCLRSGDDRVATSAQQALVRQPRDVVGAALLSTLSAAPPEARKRIIAVLGGLKYYEAIDPLLALAAQSDAASYGPALDGLRVIADPDEHDLPRLLNLLYETLPGAHRDEVEKTIALVCHKLPPHTDRAESILALLHGADPDRVRLCLPLLGRLGGPAALEVIESQLAPRDPATEDAAVRALCNWPTADMADRLRTLATEAADARHRRWALRAYVRVISLPSDRSPDATLAALQAAMQLAQQPDDRALVVSRATTARNMNCVRWLAGYLDDPALAQVACRAIVDLAHHRELRHPNLDELRPVLDQVATISRDADVAERARRYQLGL